MVATQIEGKEEGGGGGGETTVERWVAREGDGEMEDGRLTGCGRRDLQTGLGIQWKGDVKSLWVTGFSGGWCWATKVEMDGSWEKEARRWGGEWRRQGRGWFGCGGKGARLEVSGIGASSWLARSGNRGGVWEFRIGWATEFGWDARQRNSGRAGLMKGKSSVGEGNAEVRKWGRILGKSGAVGQRNLGKKSQKSSGIAREKSGRG